MARPAASWCAAGLTACLALCVVSAIFLTAVPQELLPWGTAAHHSNSTLVAASTSSLASKSSQLAHSSQSAYMPAAGRRTFTIEDDKFMKDGAPFRIISGSIHYHRIPPGLWRDRLQRVQALGLNAVQLYVPWNFHQPGPGPRGVLPWAGWQDLPRFISTAGALGLLVMLRPGPYICAEWEFGGFPAWLVQCNSSMALRTSAPDFLAAVDAWWGVLLPALAHLTYQQGGPIIMVQLENEYGYYAGDKAYLHHLRALARRHLGEQVLLYTVDGASSLPLAMGSLPGSDVLTAVDFGPTTDVAAAFTLQKRFNSPGRSPPFCVEYYTGWLTHWGEPMAQTAAATVAKTLQEILEYANGTGSVNLYMAAGGTNFGPWAGANVFSGLMAEQQQKQPLVGPEQWRLHQYQLQQQHASFGSSSSSSSNPVAKAWYQPHITSYDYSCPVGEAGTVGQVGIGGQSKFDAIRAVIAAAEGVPVEALPQLPDPAPVQAYAPVLFSEGLYVLDALTPLSRSCRNSSYCSRHLAGDSTAPHQHSAQQQPEADAALSRQRSAVLQQHPDWRSWSALQRLLGFVPATAPAGPRKQAAVEVSVGSSAAADVGVLSRSAFPLPMEQYGQYYGLIVYETQLSGAQAASAGGTLQFVAHDTAWVFLDGRLLGSSYRSAPAVIEVPPSPFAGTGEQSSYASSSSSSSHREPTGLTARASSKKLLQQLGSANTGATAAAAAEGASPNESTSKDGNGRLLQLLIWPMGRNNFGAFGGSLLDPKGLIGNVTLAGMVLSGWTVHHLCLQGGSPDSFSTLKLPWRPLVPAGLASDAGGAGMSWQAHGWGGGRRELQKEWQGAPAATAGTSSGVQPLVLARQPKEQLQQQQGRGDSSSSSSGSQTSNLRTSNISAFISTAAEAQAQAVIAAAADAASGSGPATVVARAAANIRAGWAAAKAAAADASMNVAPDGRSPLLLRGALHVPQPSASSAKGVKHVKSDSASSQPPLQQQQPASPADTFLHLGDGWGRGEVWVNGNSLGRYWAEQGPQMSLYLPGSFLQLGRNEVVLLELDGKVPLTPGQPLALDCQDGPDFAGPAAGPAPFD